MEAAVIQKPDPQFATLIKAAAFEHALGFCTRAGEHDVSHQDLGCLAVLASAEQLPYFLVQQYFDWEYYT